jgi:hypothetical protein
MILCLAGAMTYPPRVSEMLVARRDPPLHSGAHEASHFSGVPAAHTTPGVARLMTVLKVAGSLLAIPVGLVSGYSIYHANFSPEAKRQSLRASIISMLDKNADASTLRLLVRRDVSAFEGACGAVDPDAVAAFKTLLAAGTTSPATAARNATPAQLATRNPDRRPNDVAKPAPVKALPAATETKPRQRDAIDSDVNWVASVRRALVHAPEHLDEAVQAPATRLRVPQVHLSRETPAPALPPAAPVAAAPQPAADDAHPVPPAPIPDAVPAAKAADVAIAGKSAPSAFGKLIAGIPLLGRVVGQ